MTEESTPLDTDMELGTAKDEEVPEQFLTPKTPPIRSQNISDPFEPREGQDLEWSNVNMILRKDVPKDADPALAEKKILDQVWGQVPQGKVTAIMGPSGSGKTSLLNILAGRAQTNGRITIDANVRVNGHVVDPTDIKVRQRIAFVAQDDSLPVTATPREAIRFSARLRLSKNMTPDELTQLTNRMIEELGLTTCADVLVGGALLKGISGGERKRTSVGVELVARPTLVFLDEPTSGLDSFNALALCKLLGKVAQAGSSVLCTIHQPSSDSFNAFDNLILLNAGRVMYQGSISTLPSYFKERGFPNPPNYNPADHLMNVALTTSIPALEKAGFFPSDDGKILQGDSDPSNEKGSTLANLLPQSEEAPKETPGLMTQVQLLYAREFQNLYRATHAIKARTGMTLMISLAIGCLFYQVADTDFSDFINIQSTFGALLMAVMANVLSTAIPSLTALPEERPVFLREYSTNHYNVTAYFIARLTMELGVSAIQVTISSLITYFMVGMGSNFGIFWAGLYLMACTSTALGVLVGSSVENPAVAIEFLPAIFLPQILFSGFFVPPELMPDWLAWLRWLFPLTYGVKIVLAAEFDGRCDGLVPNLCDQITDNVGADVDELWWYFLVLLCLFVFLRLLALFILRSKAKKFY